LTMYDPIRRRDVGIPSLVKIRRANLVRHDLATEPVTVIICVARVHDNRKIRFDKLQHICYGLELTAIIPRCSKRYTNRAVGLGKILVCANGFLNLCRVEIVDIELRRERIRHELTHVVFVAVRIDVVEVFDFLVAEVVGCGADFIDPAGGAVKELVDAVSLAIEIIVPLVLD
jgi:hypothetical protein